MHCRSSLNLTKMPVIVFLSVMATAETWAADFDPFSTQGMIPTFATKSMLQADPGRDPCQFAPLTLPLDLSEAVEHALCHNPQTRQAWANVKAQAAVVGINQSAYLPSIDGNLGFTEADTHTVASGQPQLSSDVHSTTRTGSLNLRWVLFDFGLRSANLDTSRQQLIAEKAIHDAVLQKVILNAAQAYYDAITADEAVNASRESEHSAQESYLAAESKYKVGVASLGDRLQAETEHAKTTLNQVRAEGDFNNALGTLAITMGLSADTPLQLSMAGLATPDTNFVKSLDDIIDEAKRTHPSLIAAQALLHAAQVKVDAVRAEGLPTVSFTAGASRSDQSGQLLTDISVRNATIGVQITIPLFEGFSRSYRVQQAQAQAELRTVDLANTELQVSLDVWKSFQSLRTETESLTATDKFLKNANQSLQVALGRYKAGVGNIIELLNAQTALANARQQRIQSLSNWRTARLKLAASLGKLGMSTIR